MQRPPRSTGRQAECPCARSVEVVPTLRSTSAAAPHRRCRRTRDRSCGCALFRRRCCFRAADAAAPPIDCAYDACAVIALVERLIPPLGGDLPPLQRHRRRAKPPPTVILPCRLVGTIAALPPPPPYRLQQHAIGAVSRGADAVAMIVVEGDVDRTAIAARTAAAADTDR